MKRITLIILGVTAMLLCSTSCQKDNGKDNKLADEYPLSMVTLTIIPDYTDGTVKNYNKETNCMFLSVEVTPSSYAEILADTSKFIHKAVFSPVQTKGGFGNAFTVTPRDISYNAGAPIPFLDLCFEIDAMSAFRLDNGTYAISCTIEDKEGVHGASTAFIPISYEDKGGQGGQDDNFHNLDSLNRNRSPYMNDWTDGNVSGKTLTVGGHTVKFICPDDLKCDFYTESVSTLMPGETAEAGEISTIILRYTLPDNKYFLEIGNISGCTLSHDEQNGIITITDITDDVTIDLTYGIKN